MPFDNLDLSSGGARLQTPLQKTLEDVSIAAEFSHDGWDRRVAFKNGDAKWTCHFAEFAFVARVAVAVATVDSFAGCFMHREPMLSRR
jgi:hypothetical protein